MNRLFDSEQFIDFGRKAECWSIIGDNALDIDKLNMNEALVLEIDNNKICVKYKNGNIYEYDIQYREENSDCIYCVATPSARNLEIKSQTIKIYKI